MIGAGDVDDAGRELCVCSARAAIDLEGERVVHRLAVGRDVAGAVVHDAALRVEHEHVADVGLAQRGARERRRWHPGRSSTAGWSANRRAARTMLSPRRRRRSHDQLVHRLAADARRLRACIASWRCHISADQRQHHQQRPAPSPARNLRLQPEAQAHSTSARIRCTPSRDAVQRVLRRRRRSAGSAWS